jgi:alkylation response protein AidB-like acyl-CoA dehydrogenase
VNVVAAAVAEFGSEAQQSELLPGLLSGHGIATWAVAEPNGRWDPVGIATTAESKGGGITLNGTKSFVEAALQSDQFLVTARTGEGLSQVLVPAGTKGVTATPMESLDLVRRIGEVRFDNVELPASAVVGELGGAADAVERQLQIALALQCAETAGATERVFEFTMEWAFDRYSFGRPLASYQALKHRFADMKTWLEASQGTATAAAGAVQARADNANEIVSVAKSYIGEHCTDIMQDCVQMHGGIGVTWEHDIHLYLRRATLNRGMYGTPNQHRERICTLLGF